MSSGSLDGGGGRPQDGGVKGLAARWPRSSRHCRAFDERGHRGAPVGCAESTRSRGASWLGSDIMAAREALPGTVSRTVVRAPEAAGSPHRFSLQIGRSARCTRTRAVARSLARVHWAGFIAQESGGCEDDHHADEDGREDGGHDAFNASKMPAAFDNPITRRCQRQRIEGIGARRPTVDVGRPSVLQPALRRDSRAAAACRLPRLLSAAIATMCLACGRALPCSQL